MKLKPLLLALAGLPLFFAGNVVGVERVSEFGQGGETVVSTSTADSMLVPGMPEVTVDCGPVSNAISQSKADALERQQTSINDAMGFVDVNKAKSCQEMVRDIANSIASSGGGGFLSGALSQLINNANCDFIPTNRLYTANGSLSDLDTFYQDYSSYQSSTNQSQYEYMNSQVPVGGEGSTGGNDYLTGGR